VGGRSVPEGVLAKAHALGAIGERWLADLDALLGDLEADWDCRIGAAYDGGSGAYVAPTTMSDGSAAVVKAAIPDGLEGHSDFEAELDVLLAVDSNAYVRVLRADPSRRAMLMEPLGRSLASLDLPVERQLDVIATLLPTGWIPVPADLAVRTGAEQAEWLAASIEERWNHLGAPCPRDTVDRAVEYTHRRRVALTGRPLVLIHGDAHPHNILERLPRREPPEFTLIDPDAMASEPAHDLAICLRDWSAELLAGDTAELARAWCAILAERAHVDRRAIWEWAFIERVSTGLFAMQLGIPDAQQFLDVADRLADSTP
jgi:streptomycin 6-kinase